MTVFTSIWNTPTPTPTQGAEAWSRLWSHNNVTIESCQNWKWLKSWGHLGKCLSQWIFPQARAPVRGKITCCLSLHLLLSWLDYEEMIVGWRGAGRGPEVSQARGLFKNTLVTQVPEVMGIDFSSSSCACTQHPDTRGVHPSHPKCPGVALTALWECNLASHSFVLEINSGSSGVKSAYQCKRHGFHYWFGKSPWRREWQTHSSILAWAIPRTEEPGGLQSMGS